MGFSLPARFFFRRGWGHRSGSKGAVIRWQHIPCRSQVIADNLSDEDETDWRYVVPSEIPLGSDEIAVGIIYNADVLSLEVSLEHGHAGRALPTAFISVLGR